MSTTADKRITATFDCQGWDEQPITTESSLKITRVCTKRAFIGGMVGSGVAEYTMVYHPAAPGVTDPHAMTASYTGLMYFKGSIDGSDEGEAVFLCSGSYEGEAKASWHLDEKTTTGGLAGLKRLSGGYVSKGMKGAPAWLDLAPSTRS